MFWPFHRSSGHRSSDVVRLFLSSTFRDMRAERDHLVTSVYPELEERLADLDLAFFDVDLRWGVPRPETAQVEEPLNSWAYCRSSIDQTEPFFVGLVGHRYGSIASSEHLTDRDRKRWGEGRSITELEIRYASLDAKRPKRRSFFYFRNLPPDDMPTDVRAEYVDGGVATALEALKRDIRERYPVRSYHCAWGASGPTDLERFGQTVLEDLWSATLRDERYARRSIWKNVEPRARARRHVLRSDAPIPRETWQRFVDEARRARTPLDVEERELARFRRERTRWFCGREHELGALKAFALGQGPAADNGQVVVVHGPPGRGKTALLCKLVDVLAGQEKVEVISCFVGAADRLSDETGLLGRLMDLLEPNAPSRENNVDQLRGSLAAALHRRRRPLAIVIDGLDQLYSGAEMAWLPSVLPKPVRMVLSCADFARITDVTPPPIDPLKVLRERLPAGSFFAIPILDDSDIKAVATRFLGEHGKALEPGQLEAIVALRQAADPLYLIILLRELRALAGLQLQERVSEAIAAAADAVTAGALFEQVMERLEVLGEPGVATWMRVLSVARDGLSPAVLAEILAAEHGEPARPIAHRVRRGIRSYLQTRNGRSAFFHRAMIDAALRRYAPTRQSRRAAHASIGHALSHAWTSKQDAYAMVERLYHLVAAEDWDGVLQLLGDHAGLAQALNDPDRGRRFVLDVDFAYEHAHECDREDVAKRIVDAFLALLESEPGRQAPFDLDHVNAWLLYRPRTAFLRALIEVGAQSGHDLLSLNEEMRTLALGSRIRLGGLLRREGRLAEAEAVLVGLLGAADMNATPPRFAGRLGVRLGGLLRQADTRPSIIAYEIGYIAFLRGDLLVARRWFLYSDALARAAKDATRAWISRCVAHNCAFVGSRKTRVFEKTLVRAHRIFTHHASRGDPNAQRWLMNVAAHRLEIAMLRNDVDATRQMHAALLADAWVRQIAPADFMERFNGLLALAEHRFADAATAFGQLVGGQVLGPENRYEQLARHALDYGLALVAAGDRAGARAIWQQALALPADAGNRLWQARIRSLMADAA
jgi:hypothetical protein